MNKATYTRDDISELVSRNLRLLVEEGYHIVEEYCWSFKNSFHAILQRRDTDHIIRVEVTTSEHNNFLVYTRRALYDDKEVFTFKSTFTLEGDSDNYTLVDEFDSRFSSRDISDRGLNDYIKVDDRDFIKSAWFEDSVMQAAASATMSINNIISSLPNKYL